MPVLVLASASPRRLELLRQIGIVPDHVDPADIDEGRIEPADQPHDPAEMDGPRRRRLAALDMKLGGDVVFKPGGAPLAGPGADQELAAQFARYPRPARSCTVSNPGRRRIVSSTLRAAARPSGPLNRKSKPMRT